MTDESLIVRPEPLQIDSWHAAELNAARWMRMWGWYDAAVTPTGADGGIDVRSSGALAQVKWEAKQVGRAALQKLVGAAALEHELALLFFSGAGYSREALTYANAVGMALFKYGLDGSTEAMNDAARAILGDGEHSTADEQNALRHVAEDIGPASDAPSALAGSWVSLPDRHHVVTLEEALLANPKWSKSDREQICRALEATGTVAYTVKDPKRDCIFGWNAEGRKTVDVSGRTVYFKEVTDADIPRLPAGTFRSPKTGWIILGLG